MYAEEVGDLLHRIGTSLKGPRHRLIPEGITVSNIREGDGEWPALGARNLAQSLGPLIRAQ